MSKTNKEYCMPKIEKNIERNIKVNEELRNQGWIVLKFWQKYIEKNLDKCIKKIQHFL